MRSQAWGGAHSTLAIAAGAIASAALCAILAAASGGTIADRVLGQIDFIHNAPNFVDASALDQPRAVAISIATSPNHVYVADTANSRVLGWRDAGGFATGAPADIVIGQEDFYSYACNQSGTPSAATLCQPAGVAADAAGNLYVGDTQGNRVTVFADPFAIYSATGETSGFAAAAVFGQGGDFSSAACNQGGIGSQSLCAPQGLAVDSAGNLFVADVGNNRLLAYFAPFAASSGVPALSAKTSADLVFGQGDFSGAACNRGGAPTSTSLCFGGFLGVGAAVDSSGNLYVADPGNGRALEYDGPFGSGRLNLTSAALIFSGDTLAYPAGAAVDAFGNFYLASEGYNQLCIYDSAVALSNTIPNLIIGPGAGNPSASSLSFPEGLAIDYLNNLYVTDTGNNRVLEYNELYNPPDNAIANRALGQPDLLHGAVNRVDAIGLQAPAGIAADTSAGPPPHPLYVADTANNRILGWPDAASFASGAAAAIVIGQPDLISSRCNNGGAGGDVGGVGADSLCAPAGIAIDAARNLYTADTNNHRVLRFPDPFASYTASGQRAGFAADLVIGQGSSFTSHACNAGRIGAASLCAPGAVELDPSGGLYIADSGNNRVLEFVAPVASGQAASRVFGQGASGDAFTSAVCSNGASGNPAPSATGMCNPQGVTIDSVGNLYIADTGNDRVLGFDAPASGGLPDTVASIVIGQQSFAGSGCNAGAASGDITGLGPDSLCAPTAVALDAAGDLFVADSADSRVLEYSNPSASGATAGLSARAVFGQDGNMFQNSANDGDGPGDANGLGADSLFTPLAIALDGSANLYIADSGNNRVLAFAQPIATPSPTATATASPTPTPSATPTVTPTPSATATATPTAVATATPTSTPTPDPKHCGKLTVTPAAVRFGRVRVGATVKKSVSIRNTGKYSLYVTVESTLESPFEVESGAGSFSLEREKSQAVIVTFTPQSEGATPPQTLAITSDDPNHRQVNVRVTGAGKK
ncbi:MAG TPA: choice-of-anchor D domain-containing protein [Candidatus Binataceae bacterium]|nr:choice-of-anchor D domain-containing protein [Candidatus Binataceae bacterium]